MQSFKLTFISFLMLSLPLSLQAKKTAEPKFFTTRNASSWSYILNDKTLNPADVFLMGDGVLHITGVSSGYLRTNKKYSNYTLKLEYRWTDGVGNSGVLVHIQPKDSIWPVCFQVQQRAGAAGDVICMNGLRAKECTDSVKFTVPKMKPTNEKTPGEWNSMEIISKKGTLTVFINGELQNKVTGLTATKGYIGFQNEGKPLEFRKLVVE
ncbi:MAG TPA: DUF1080 domain-containing protein [Paludibacter sp.]|nr:DUF1080 domain-containing protein [Paludibacter sp.]